MIVLLIVVTVTIIEYPNDLGDMYINRSYKQLTLGLGNLMEETTSVF